MHFSTSIVLAALPFLAAATQPLKVRQSQQQPPVYSMIAISDGDNDVNNQPIVASNESFYIYRTSTSLCGSDSPISCAKPTQISLEDNSQAALSVYVPAGQNLFVASTGALSYTPPHASSPPAGAYSTGFSAVKTGDNDPSSRSNLMFAEAPAPVWLACPVEVNNEASYQIFANVTGVQVPSTSVSHCHDVAIELVPGDASESPFEFS